MALTQIVNSPSLYIDNLQISNNATTPNTKIDIAAGAARDSTNALDLILSAGVTIDASVNGLNGLDTGTFAASKIYYVYIIGDQTGYNATGCIMSLSASYPQMPAGRAPGSYSNYRMIGAMVSDGSTHFIAGKWFGNHQERLWRYDGGVSALSGGSATTLTGVVLTNIVPAIASTPVILDISFTAATPGDSVSLTGYGSTSTTNTRFSSAAAVVSKGQVEVEAQLNSSAPTILYVNSAGSCATTLLVSGYKMSL